LFSRHDHERLAGKARIGTQQDAHLGQRVRMRVTIRAIFSTLPALASNVGRAQFAGQQMAAAEHVKGQIAIGVARIQKNVG
jgi:hypothetical protein